MRRSRMVEALRRFDLHWLEEPVWPPEDHAGLAKVRAAGAVIAAGENAAGLDRLSPRCSSWARSMSRSRA